MIELRKTELSLNGSTACVIFEPGRGCKHGSNDWLVEIQEMFSRWAKAFQSCELIMVPVTGFTSSSEGVR